MNDTLPYARLEVRPKRYISPFAIAFAILLGEFYFLALFCEPVFQSIFKIFKTDVPSITALTQDTCRFFRSYLAFWIWVLPIVHLSVAIVRAPLYRRDPDELHRVQWRLLLLMLMCALLGSMFALAMCAPFVTIGSTVSSPK